MKTQFIPRFASFKVSVLITLFVLLVTGSIALLAAANRSTGLKFRNASRVPGVRTPTKTTTRAVIRVTPDGVVLDHNLLTSRGEPVAPATRERRLIGPSGNTLWMVDDQNTIADGVRIDSNNVWGAWILTGARLSIYPITGNGTPLWEFSSFNSGNTGVAAAKGSDRAGLMESNAAGNDFLQHGFRSTSNGTPDWSFQYPVSDPNLPASSFKVAVSRDGSTMAAVVSDSVTQNQTLYVFDAATGAIRQTWTNSLRMDAVALTDNGSIALVTQDNQATLIDTGTGNIVFSIAGSGAGLIYYPISGDGSVFAVGGFDFDVYAFNGTTYNQVIHYTQANSWFGGASAVSRDGSTVGTFAGDYANGWLSGAVLLFDVPTGQLLGSYPVSGSGSYSGTPIGAASNDDGSVMAFASWGTQFHDWPEVMVFNRSVQLIGQINFPGSAFSVDVSSDGQYVVGGAKAVHANQFGSGGRIELIQLQTTPTPTPSPSPTATATATATAPFTPTPTPSPCIVYIAGPHCDSVINTQPVDFDVQLSDPTDPGSVQPTDFMVNGIPSDSYIFSPTYIVFHFNTSPVVQGLNVMHIPACAFNCHIGCTPEFTCNFTYQPSTPTPTATATVTPTPTARPTITPRPNITPRMRPTPPPRPL